MRISSKICNMLGLKYPIFQGGMSRISNHALVAAVGRAGAMGFIGSGGMSPEYLCKEIRRTRHALGHLPFGVNLMLKDRQIEKQVDMVIKEQVPAVSTGAGNPERFMSYFKKAGILVFPVVASCALAEQMEARGAAALIVEGTESGGHIGLTTTLALVPQVVDHVSIPVVAAGGIGDTRGLLACFMLGAEAVQMGTLFLTAEECPIHINYKNAVLSATDRSTVVTGISIDRPVRAIKNRFTRDIRKLEACASPAGAILDRRKGRLRAAAFSGDVKSGHLMCGQIAGLIQHRKPAYKIIESLVGTIHTELDLRLLNRLQ